MVMVWPYAISKSRICSALGIKPNIRHLSWRAGMGKLNVNEMQRVETALPKLDRYQQQAIVTGIFNPVLELEEYGGIMKTMAQNGKASLSALRLPDERVPRLAAPSVTTSLQALQVSTLSARSAASGSRPISQVIDELLEIALKDDNLDRLATPLIEIMDAMGEPGKIFMAVKEMTEAITDPAEKDSIRSTAVVSLSWNKMFEQALIVARSITNIEMKAIELHDIANGLIREKEISAEEFMERGNFLKLSDQRYAAACEIAKKIEEPRSKIEALCKVGTVEALSRANTFAGYEIKNNPQIQVNLLEFIIAKLR